MEKKDNVEYLLKGLDIIARDIHSVRPVNPLYIVVGLTSLSIWLVVLLGYINTELIYGKALYLFSGLIAFTTLYTALFMITYKTYKHLEYSTYYFSHLNDILKTMNKEHIEDLIEKITLLRKPRIEYSLLALAAGLTTLLYYDLLLDLALLVFFTVITGYYLYLSLDILSNHSVIENKIFHSIYKILGISEELKYTVIKNNVFFKTLIYIVSLMYISPYIVYFFNQTLDLHIADHRLIHKKIKTKIYSMIETTQ